MHATSARARGRVGGIRALLERTCRTLVHALRPRNRALLAALFLGLPAEAQMAWRRLFPAEAPLARWLHGMAHDSVRGRTYLFGGWDGTLTTILPDMWEWDGRAWLRLFPSPIPSPRRGPAMAFDTARGRTLLYGGMGAKSLGDTWEWDGKTWHALAPPSAPAPRWTPALAYDPVHRNHVLFGGWDDAAQAALDETWTWDGGAWTRRQPAARPKARFYHALAGDGRRGRVLLFGGVDPGPPYAYLGDTWEWDGADWIEFRPTVSPPPTARHAMAFDEARGRVVLCGGNGEGFALQPETWEWDGALWHRRAFAGPVPAAGVCPALAYDPARQTVLLFGGYGGQPPAAHGETWEYSCLAPAAFAGFGQACPPSAPPLLEAQGLPWLGEGFVLRARPLAAGSAALGLLGVSDASWAGLPLPLDLGILGFPSCSIYASGDLVLALPMQAGGAEWTLALPNDPALAGRPFFAQVLALNGGRLAASGGGRALAGRK